MSALHYYRLFIPKAPVAANQVYFDMFNAAGSATGIRIHSIIPIVSGEVAVTGVVGLDLFLTRTTAIGTGGTAAVIEGTSLTVPALTAMDNSQPLTSMISARALPTAGATAGAVLSWRSLQPEESNSGAYVQVWDMARSHSDDVEPIRIYAGNGIRVVQGSVASVGNIGFDVIFSTRTV